MPDNIAVNKVWMVVWTEYTENGAMHKEFGVFANREGAEMWSENLHNETARVFGYKIHGTVKTH